MVLNLIKRKKSKQKKKRYCPKSNLAQHKYFTSYKYDNVKEFSKRSFISKLNDLKDSKDKLELLIMILQKLSQIMKTR